MEHNTNLSRLDHRRTLATFPDIGAATVHRTLTNNATPTSNAGAITGTGGENNGGLGFTGH